MKIERQTTNGITLGNTHSNTIGYNRSTKQANDQHKRSPNYNQSMNRKKEASPTITTGNQSSRTIKEDDELIRNAVSGPFAQGAVYGAVRCTSPTQILSGHTQVRGFKTGSPLCNPAKYINQSIQSLNQEKSNSTQSNRNQNQLISTTKNKQKSQQQQNCGQNANYQDQYNQQWPAYLNTLKSINSKQNLKSNYFFSGKGKINSSQAIDDQDDTSHKNKQLLKQYSQNISLNENIIKKPHISAHISNINGMKQNQIQFTAILGRKPTDGNNTSQMNAKMPGNLQNNYYSHVKTHQKNKQTNMNHFTQASPKISNLMRTSPSNLSIAENKDVNQHSVSHTQKNKSRCGSPGILSSQRSFIKPDHKIPKATLDLSSMYKNNKVKKPQRNIQILTSRSKDIKNSPLQNIIKNSSNSSIISNNKSVGMTNSQNFIYEKNNNQRNSYSNILKPKTAQNMDNMKIVQIREASGRGFISNNYSIPIKKRNQSNSGALSSQKYQSQLSIRSSASVGNERSSLNRSNSKKMTILESSQHRYNIYKKTSLIKSASRGMDFKVSKNSQPLKITGKTNKKNVIIQSGRVSNSDLRQNILKTSSSLQSMGSINMKQNKSIGQTLQLNNVKREQSGMSVLKRLSQLNKPLKPQLNQVKYSIKTSPRTNLGNQNNTKNFTVMNTHSSSGNIQPQKRLEQPVLQIKQVSKKKTLEIVPKKNKQSEFNQIIKKYTPQDIRPPKSKNINDLKQLSEGKKLFNEIISSIQITNNLNNSQHEKQIIECIKKNSFLIDPLLNQKFLSYDSTHLNIFEYLAQTSKYPILLDYLLSKKCVTVVIYKNENKQKNKNGFLNKNTALHLSCPQLHPDQIQKLLKQQSGSEKDLSDFNLLMKIKENQINEILMYRLSNSQSQEFPKQKSLQESQQTQKIQENYKNEKHTEKNETLASSFSSENNSDYQEVRQVEIDEFICSQNTLSTAQSQQNILKKQNTKTKLENIKIALKQQKTSTEQIHVSHMVSTPQRCLKELNQSAQQAQQKESTKSRGGELSQIEEMPSPFDMRNFQQKRQQENSMQSKLSNPTTQGPLSQDVNEQDKLNNYNKQKSEKFDSQTEWKGSTKNQKSDGNHALHMLSDANSSIKPPKQQQSSAKLFDKRYPKKEDNVSSKNLGSQADQRGNELIDKQDRHSGLGQSSSSKIMSAPGNQSSNFENCQNSAQIFLNANMKEKNNSIIQSQKNEKRNSQNKQQLLNQLNKNNQFKFNYSTQSQNNQNQNDQYENQAQSQSANNQQNGSKSSQKHQNNQKIVNSSKLNKQNSDFGKSSDFRPDTNYQTSRGQILTVQTLNTIHQSNETKKQSGTNGTQLGNIYSNQTEFDVQTPIKDVEKGEKVFKQSNTKTPNLVYENVSSLKQNMRKIQLSEDQSNGQNSRSESRLSKKSQRPLKNANQKIVSGESFAYANFMNECDFEEEKIQIQLQPQTFNPQPSTFAVQKSEQLQEINIQKQIDLNQIGPNSFIAHQLLGTGSFGEVFLVEELSSGKLMAMKVLSKAKIREQKLMKYAYTEKQIMAEMSAIDHPFIVKLYYTFQTKDHLYMIMQFCEGGDLSQYLELEGCFPESKARRYICEIMCAIEALHEKNIIFRDLKPDNICLDADGHAMLTDFGLSRMNIKNDTKGAESFCGSYAYLAPEMLKKKGHGKAVDWYLIGVVLYELLTGMPPYYDDDKDILFKNISNNQLEFPPNSEFPLSDECKDLLIKLLEKDPSKRLGITNGLQEIKNHSFFASIDWSKIEKKQYSQPKAYLAEMAMQIIKKQPYALKDHPRTKGSLCLQDNSEHFEDWEINMVQKFNVSKR